MLEKPSDFDLAPTSNSNSVDTNKISITGYICKKKIGTSCIELSNGLFNRCSYPPMNIAKEAPDFPLP